MSERRRYAKIGCAEFGFERVLVVTFKDDHGNPIADGHIVKWSQHCSGCTEVPECTLPPERGLGCDECGYTGRRRRREWVPLNDGECNKFDAYMARLAADRKEAAR